MNLFSSFRPNLFLNLILVYIIWGSTYIGVKIGLSDLSPLLLTSIRFGIGGLLLFLFCVIAFKLPSINEAKGSIIIGVTLTGVGTSSVAYGINHLPSGLVALLVALLPIWTFILDYLIFSKTRPSTFSLIGMLVGAIGVLFLFNPFGAQNSLDASKSFPLFIIFLGSVAWAWGSLISSKLEQASGLTGVSIQMLAGGIFALILSLIIEQNQWTAIKEISTKSIIAMSYLIIIGSYIGYTAYIWLIRNAPPLLTSTYAFVNPVIALFLGYLYAHEKLNKNSLIASLIILVGVVLMTLGRRRDKE